MTDKPHKRKVNDDYGIYYNQTHESQTSSKDSNEELGLEVQVMSRVDWIIALRNIFHRLQSEGLVEIQVLIRQLQMANFDLVPQALYEVSHEAHE